MLPEWKEQAGEGDGGPAGDTFQTRQFMTSFLHPEWKLSRLWSFLLFVEHASLSQPSLFLQKAEICSGLDITGSAVN